MSRSPSRDKVGLKRGAWTSEEDQKLKAYVEKHGHGNWQDVPEKAGLQRCGRSCRLRWINYLRPDIKRGKFSSQEEQTIFRLHALLGNRWSVMASHLPGRTDNDIKNYWNTHLKKRLIKMGIDPITHRAKTRNPVSTKDHPKDSSTLSHMAQWEATRLEAESILVRASKLMPNPLDAVSAQSNNDARVPPSRPLPPAQCLDILKAWQEVVSGMFLNASNFSENIILKQTMKYDEDSTANIEFATSPLTCKGDGNYSNCFEKQNQMHEMTYPEDNNAWFLDSFRSEIEYVPILNMVEGSLEISVRDFDYWE